jgi:hypothetical protein
MATTKTDPATKPEATGAALAKAAIQTLQRALFTAQLAADALRKGAGEMACGERALGVTADAETMEALRDALLEAFSAIPKGTRDRMSAAKATITSDELIDLLALSVQG